MSLHSINRLTTWLIRPCVVALLALLSLPATSATVLQNGTLVHLNKTARDQIAIDLQLSTPQPVSRITARIADQPVPVSSFIPFPAPGQTSAMLFLVDTSDPSRQQAVDRAIRHIEQVVTRATSHIRFGLARFDTDLHLLSSIGTERERLIDQARTIKAVGKTTELYRNTLGAIRILQKYPADRKFLFMLSDGLAEDRAYFHRDVVQAALKNNVSIYTIGYSGTVSRTVALQTLRRLSEDTGGQYLPTAPGSYKLDESALLGLLNTLDSGMQFKINLKPAIGSGIGGNQLLDLMVELPVGSYSLSIPVNLPRPSVSQIQQPAHIPATGSSKPAQQVIVKHVPVDHEFRDNSWLMLLAVSLLMLGLLIFLALRLRSGSEPRSKTHGKEHKDEEAYAWLDRIDGGGNERFPIHSAMTKIGRFRGNDVPLHDPAVSRYHAEIRFSDDGHFMIADLGSKNGILVNDEEVYESILHDQDVIEIGDIRLRFSIQSDFAADMQDTQMFRTQFPPASQANH